MRQLETAKWDRETTALDVIDFAAEAQSKKEEGGDVSLSLVVDQWDFFSLYFFPFSIESGEP